MYVEEKDRSWCSSNAANDHRAITIEVASDTKHPYAVNDKAYAALIDLCVDICKRNGIQKLVWSTNKSDRVNHKNGCNMTVHRDYANKSCPGDYLYERHGAIAQAVNARLGAATEVKPEVPTETAYPEKLTTGYYRVRKTWKDSKSQVGAYRVLQYAKAAADKNPGTYVFSNDGVAIYPEKAAETYRIHTVVKGDTLWDIAKKYLGNGARYGEIKKLNGLTSNVIYSGTKLKIPN